MTLSGRFSPTEHSTRQNTATRQHFTAGWNQQAPRDASCVHSSPLEAAAFFNRKCEHPAEMHMLLQRTEAGHRAVSRNPFANPHVLNAFI